MSTRQLDPDATRAAILDAASTLFMESGFDGVSMSGISKRAGVTKSLIHHHFGSKRGIWEAVKADLFEPYERAQRALIDDESLSGVDAVRETMRLFFQAMRDDARMRRMTTWMSLSNELCQMPSLEYIVTQGVARFAEGQRKGIFRPDVEARFLLQIILGVTHSWFTFRDTFREHGLADPDPLAEEQLYLDAITRVITRGFAPTQDPSTPER